MPFTTIRSVANNTSYDVVITNWERPRNTPPLGLGRVGPGGINWLNAVVPWCQEAESFDNHKITVDIGPVTFAIWQSTFTDGDYVRCSGGAFADWSNPGPHILGESSSGGDRTLVVRSPSTGGIALSFENYRPGGYGGAA